MVEIPQKYRKKTELNSLFLQKKLMKSKSRFSAILVLLILSLNACKPSAENIINECIEVYGGKKYDNFEISLEFRNMHYSFKNKNGKYSNSRVQIDSSGRKIEDMVSNEGFERKINGLKVEVADTMVAKYSNSINSVVYFFLLPKPLNDPAVRKELIGTSRIKGKTYNKIKVSFDEQGGGVDHNDVFLYWIDQNTKTMDYFAYSYETNGGGLRFREAVNCKTENGIKFCDYKNYGFEDLNTNLEDLDKMFEADKIPLKSEIINLNVKIK